MHGWVHAVDINDPLHHYGSDAPRIRALAAQDKSAAERIHPDSPYLVAEIDWAVQEEMAMRLEDVLARRLRMLFLDARAAMEVAPFVAQRMSRLLGKDDGWVAREVADFRETARHYLP
jgi:glycerol-3-phosphate dehydrogenase